MTHIPIKVYTEITKDQILYAGAFAREALEVLSETHQIEWCEGIPYTVEYLKKERNV